MKQQSNLSGRYVYVVDGSRTPFLKAKGVGPFTGSDLAVAAGMTLLNRVVALRLGCGDKVPAFTVMRNCASGMQALDNAAMQIASGRSNLILAGGTDAMSHAPFHCRFTERKWHLSSNPPKLSSTLIPSYSL